MKRDRHDGLVVFWLWILLGKRIVGEKKKNKNRRCESINGVCKKIKDRIEPVSLWQSEFMSNMGKRIGGI